MPPLTIEEKLRLLAALYTATLEPEPIPYGAVITVQVGSSTGDLVTIRTSTGQVLASKPALEDTINEATLRLREKLKEKMERVQIEVKSKLELWNRLL